jgi:hypothetical protein
MLSRLVQRPAVSEIHSAMQNLHELQDPVADWD